jgi:hypothetical protein
MSEAPKQVWLVKPKSDASFYMVCETKEEAETFVAQSSSGAEMAGPYVLRHSEEP